MREKRYTIKEIITAYKLASVNLIDSSPVDYVKRHLEETVLELQRNFRHKDATRILIIKPYASFTEEA